MRAVTDADLVQFVLAGCNAAEVSAYVGCTESTALCLIHRARLQIANPEAGQVIA